MFFSLLLVFYYSISHIVKIEKDFTWGYISAMIDKHNRTEQLKGPKIIFTGGSNIAFGNDSERIESEFKVPVVNLGLHVGLGLNFIISELQSLVNPNDVVFLSLEYFIEKDGDYNLQKHVSKLHSKASAFYNFNIINEIESHINKTRENLKNKKSLESKNNEEIYIRKGFNKYGDVTSHLNVEPLNDIGTELLNYRYWDGIDALNNLNEFAKSRNICIFYLFPPYSKSVFKINEDVIRRHFNDLKKNIEIEIIGTPQDFAFDDSLYFDHYYHLTIEGRKFRTTKLIELIKNNSKAMDCIKGIQSE